MEPSAAGYTNFLLRLYDFVVLVVSNHFAWRCPTGSVLLPLYEKHTKESSAHLDIGAGTGYYTAKAAASGALSKTRLLTFCDLNPNTLVYAERRLRKAKYRGAIETFEHNVFHPFPESMWGKYDSVALFCVFHCLPGPLRRKANEVFANVGPLLAPGGVVYGSTVLGKGVPHNWLGRWLMGFYNKRGVFGNTEDTEEGLRKALEESFDQSEIRVVGAVALFEAGNPRAPGGLQE